MSERQAERQVRSEPSAQVQLLMVGSKFACVARVRVRTHSAQYEVGKYLGLACTGGT